MTESIIDALDNLEEYTRNAEELARGMAAEEAIEMASRVLELEAAVGRKREVRRKTSTTINVVASAAMAH